MSDHVAPAIRPMTSADLRRVLDLERDLFSDPWPESLFHEELQHTEIALPLVAEIGAVIIGYSMLAWVYDEVHLENLAVDRAWWGRGIAQALLDDAFARAAARDLDSMLLEVRSGNARAQRFYERNGFVRLSVRRRYYQEPVEDAIVMSRSVRRLPEPGAGLPATGTPA